MQRKERFALERVGIAAGVVAMEHNVGCDVSSSFLLAFANFSGLQLRRAAFGACVTHENGGIRWRSALDSCRCAAYDSVGQVPDQMAQSLSAIWSSSF